MLRRVAELPEALRGSATRRRGVLAKVAKPIQEERVDLPTIGVATIEGLDRAGLAGVVGVAGKMLVVDRAAVAAAADAAGLFVAGVAEAASPKPARVTRGVTRIVLKVMLVAVEASADGLGAGLMRALTGAVERASEFRRRRRREDGCGGHRKPGRHRRPLAGRAVRDRRGAVSARALRDIETTVRLAETERPDVANPDRLLTGVHLAHRPAPAAANAEGRHRQICRPAGLGDPARAGAGAGAALRPPDDPARFRGRPISSGRDSPPPSSATRPSAVMSRASTRRGCARRSAPGRAIRSW